MEDGLQLDGIWLENVAQTWMRPGLAGKWGWPFSGDWTTFSTHMASAQPYGGISRASGAMLTSRYICGLPFFWWKSSATHSSSR